MGLQYLSLPLLLGLAGVAAAAQAVPAKNPLGTGQPVVAAGHLLFNRTCTACHGIDGGEGERRFFRLSEAAIFQTIKGGIPGTTMPAMPLPDEDIWRIVVFIRAMRGSASETDVPGDTAHGTAIFSGKGNCEHCHMLDGKGGMIGPDLSNVGAQMTLKHLRESLSEDGPIPPDYRPVKVVTCSGATVEGIAKNEDAFSIQILDYEDKLHLYDMADLRSVENGKKSLMPHDYDKVLSAAEYQDLVAMLARQTQTNVSHKQEGEGEVGR